MPQLGSLDLPVEAGQEGELWLGRPGTSFSAGCRAFSATDNYYASLQASSGARPNADSAISHIRL